MLIVLKNNEDYMDTTWIYCTSRKTLIYVAQAST